MTGVGQRVRFDHLELVPTRQPRPVGLIENSIDADFGAFRQTNEANGFIRTEIDDRLVRRLSPLRDARQDDKEQQREPGHTLCFSHLMRSSKSRSTRKQQRCINAWTERVPHTAVTLSVAATIARRDIATLARPADLPEQEGASSDRRAPTPRTGNARQRSAALAEDIQMCASASSPTWKAEDNTGRRRTLP